MDEASGREWEGWRLFPQRRRGEVRGRGVGRSWRGRPLIGLCALLLGLLLRLSALGALAAYRVASLAAAPPRASLGPPPPDLPVEPVAFARLSGGRLAGWLIPGRQGAGAVLLLHGVSANRLAMLERARFLHGQGLTVLLF